MALVPGKVVTLHQAVPPIQSLELPVAVPLGTGVMVGGAEGLLAEEGSPITVIVSVGYPIGVKHVVVPASVLDQGAAMIQNRQVNTGMQRDWINPNGLLGLSHVVKSSRVVVKSCGSLL